MAKGKTQAYYDRNPAAKAKKNEYQKEFNKKPSQVAKRVELNKANRDAGTYGNGDKRDIVHKNGKISGTKPQSANRGSNSDSAGDRRARPKKKK